MSSGIESVTSAMEMYVTMQEVAARNVANVTTPGFKRNIAMFESGDETGDDVPDITQVRLDLSQGSLQETHNALDLAIRGDGYFTIDGLDGLRYTRNGSFRLNENRVLVTQQGRAVLGENGEIQIPDDAAQIIVLGSGEIDVDGRVVGKLRMTAFEAPGMLRQAGACEFLGDMAGARPAGDYLVYQGSLENSNVRPISELVQMMSALRHYEASANSLKAIEQSATKLYAWART